MTRAFRAAMREQDARRAVRGGDHVPAAGAPGAGVGAMRRLILALLGAFVLGGCLFNPMPPWWGTADGSPPAHYVQVIGDSLVVATQWNGGPHSQHVLTDELAAAGYATSVNAAVGATSNDLVGKVSRPEEDILV